MKKKITESQLRDIIAESVRTILGNQQAYNDCLKVGDLRKMISQLDDDDTVVFVDGERRAHHFVVNTTIRSCRWQEGLLAYSQFMHEEPIKALYIQMEA